MKYFRLVCFLPIFLAFQCIQVSAGSMMDQAVQNVSEKVIAAIPENTHIRLIAITGIKGDDGTLTRNLTEAFQASSHFILVERKELDNLIEEQGFQVSDLVSRNQRVEPGQIRGVEGIVFGEVLKASSLPLSSTYRVFLQLDNVQTGDILMAREFSATINNPHRDAILKVAVACGILLILVIFFKIRIRSRALQRRQNTEDIRRQIGDQFTGIFHNFQQNRSRLGGNDNPFLPKLTEIEFEIGMLKDRITSGFWGQGTGRKSKRLYSIDKKILKGIKELREHCDKLIQKVRDGDTKGANRLVSEIKDQISTIKTRIVHRA